MSLIDIKLINDPVVDGIGSAPGVSPACDRSERREVLVNLES
jgi:hypothetical protein